ncbi:MAG: SAM-dependent methyltransferase [Pseudomonadota bacterium]
MTRGHAYDADLRSDTPLLPLIKAEIAETGPMPVSRYADLCLQHPELGYYRKAQAIGAGGDFVTAPEISQVFGELIGLWSAFVWQQMGSPTQFELIEFGPGRGTLMADALRATRTVPGFQDAANIRLVDVNRTLEEHVEDQLATYLDRIAWGQPDPKNTLPRILIGNEYLDVFIPRQFQSRGGQWFERAVVFDTDGALQFGLSPKPAPAALTPTGNPTDGLIYEANVMAPGLIRLIAQSSLIAGLFIDYGHTAQQLGDTLQAVRSHAPEHPLTSPGEADLTCQVDFAAVASAFRSAGAVVDGPVTQAEFLGSLGIIERASKLMSSNPQRAGDIEASILRLIAPNGMGTRFKAIGIRSPDLPPLPAFPAPTTRTA